MTAAAPPAHIPKEQLCLERGDDPLSPASQDFCPRFSKLGTKGLNIAKMQECHLSCSALKECGQVECMRF